MAEQQVDRKPEATITGARIALVGTIMAAIIGATATITVALLQRKNSDPATAPTATPGFLPIKVFDESALEGDEGVKKVLIGRYGVQADQIQSVDCPADQKVKAGNKFTCTVQFGGDDSGEKEVDITIPNDSGEYQVGIPRNR